MNYREMRSMMRKIPKVLKELDAVKAMRRAVIDEIDMVESGINPHGASLSGMPHGTGISKSTENEALKLITLKERYRERLNKYTARIEELEVFINRIEVAMCWVSKEQEQILRMRYWRCASMIAVSIDMNLSEPQCFRLERQAFEIMGEHLWL